MHVAAHLDVDVVALETEDQVTVMLQFDAPQPPRSGPRMEHTAVVVLDRSGSMAGPRLHNAKQALLRLVDRLDDRDRFGLVVFDDQAQVLVPAVPPCCCSPTGWRMPVSPIRTSSGRSPVRYVELPLLVEHVISLPVSVNVVPADVAADRLPSPVVSQEKLLMQVQRAKKRSEEALRYGDVAGARTELQAAAAAMACAPASAETAVEADWLDQTLQSLTERDEGYNLERMRASSSRAGRGYKTRYQGGETA